MNRLRRLQRKLKVPGIVFTLGFAVLLTQQISVRAQSKPISFTLQKMDGGTITSADLSGKVVVLALGGKNDPLDQGLLPQLQRLSDRYQGKSVAIIWVSIDSTKAGSRNYASDDDIKAFVTRAKYTGMIARDPDGSLVRLVGANQLPTIVLLDKTGSVSLPLIKGFDPDNQDAVAEFSARIDKLLG